MTVCCPRGTLAGLPASPTAAEGLLWQDPLPGWDRPLFLRIQNGCLGERGPLALLGLRMGNVMSVICGIFGVTALPAA